MAAGATYQPIATTTLASAAASYTFNSIPSTYTDLILIIGGTADALTAMQVQLNGDTGTNYSFTNMQGDGSSATSSRTSNAGRIDIGLSGPAQSNNIVHFQNYANTTTFKTLLARGNTTEIGTRATVGLWRSTSAINSIKIYPGGTLGSGTVLTLYGITAA